jgi:hypothetical protein
LLGLLLTVGNLVLAYAEYFEFNGVRDGKVAAPVYSMARYLYAALTSTAAVVVWVVLFPASLGVVWHVVLMCIDRWMWVVPIALASALTDMTRMCVKVIIAATFMYMIGSSSSMVDVVTQWVAKMIDPETYDNVHAGPQMLLVAGSGALLIIVASIIYPHPTDPLQPGWWRRAWWWVREKVTV